MASEEARATPVDPEKTAVGVSVQVRESNSTEHVNEKRDIENCEHVQWEPGFWKRFPWLGFAAIMTMLLCIAMDGVILGTSRWKYREEWPAHQKWEFISKEWRKKSQIEPHVLLAVVNTVTNVALGVAIGHGVAIAWWRRVLKGSTIEDLHRSWGFSASVLQLVTAGKWFNYIALAALMAKVALIDNVLLQKAVSTTPGYFNQESMNLSLPIAKVWPDDYAGVISNDSQTMAVSYAWSWDMYYQRSEQIIDPTEIFYTKDLLPDDKDELNRGYDTGCIGFCDAAFQGFGFEWDCAAEETSEEYDVTPKLARQNSRTALGAAIAQYLKQENTTEDQSNAPLSKIFDSVLQKNPVLAVVSRFIPMGGTAEDAAFPHDVPAPYNNRTLETGVIGMQFQYSSYTPKADNDVEVCSGQTYTRFCILKPSIISYTLDIANVTKTADESDQKILGADNGITLIDRPGLNYSDPNYDDAWVHGQFSGYKIVGPAYEPYEPAKHDSNLKFIESWLEKSFSTIMLMEWIDNANFTGYAPNMNPTGDLVSGVDSPYGAYWVQFDPAPSCELDQQSPVSNIGYSLNDLMVRASMRAATVWHKNAVNVSVPLQSAIQRHQQGQSISSLYYTTDWAFGGAAMGVIFFCVLCVLPSYYGFWQLGRKVTLGPIEVAGAFQAPVMQHPTVATNGEVDQFVKDIGQRRVRYGQVEGEQRLAVAPPTEVVRPGT